MSSEYSFAPVRSGDLQSKPSTLEVAYSQISKYKDPLLALPSYAHDFFSERETFPRTIEPIFEAIAEDLRVTNTKQLYDLKKELYLKDIKDRNVFQQATMGQQIKASFLNPTTYVPIFRAVKAPTVLGGGYNFAITTGALSIAEEVPRGIVYENYDPVEGGVYVASNTALGFVFGSGVKIGVKAITNGFDTSHRALNRHSQSIREQENWLKIEKDLPKLAKEERIFKDMTDLDLRSEAVSSFNAAQGLKQFVEKVLRGNGPDDFNESGIISILDEIEELTKRTDDLNQELNLRRFDQGLSQIENPYSLASSWFDSIDIMPTPIKTILKRKSKKTDSLKFKKALNNFHRTALELFNDSSLLYTGQKFGLSLKPSVAVRNNLRKADVWNFERAIIKSWQKEHDLIQTEFFPETRGTLRGTGVTVDDWINDLTKRYLRGHRNFSPNETEALEVVFKYFKKMEDEGLESGVLGSAPFLTQRIASKQSDLRRAIEKLTKVQNKTAKSLLAKKNKEKSIKHWQGRVNDLRDQLAEFEQRLKNYEQTKFKPAGPDEPYFMREWDAPAIIKDEKGPKLFRREALAWVKDNPTGFEYNSKKGVWEAKDLKGDIQAQNKYVDNIILGIISDADGTSSVSRRSVHYPSRNFTIPNSKVVDFINTDVRDIVRKYNIKMGSRIDFANNFGNRSFKEVADTVTDDLIDAGMSVKEANKLRMNLTIGYRRVTATSISDPTSLTNRGTQFLKEFTSLNYLGSAGPTALGDIPKIIMEQSFRPIIKGLRRLVSDPEYRQQYRDVKSVYGEALELSLGYVQRQILEESGSTLGSKTWDKIKQGGFILNGLGPMTVGLKSFTGMLSVHNIMEKAARVSDGSASKFDIEYLNRHGLDAAKAKEILKGTEIKKGELTISNIETWAQKGISYETTLAFKAAVNQSINNTIISSSAATRFTYADGSIFIPEGFAKKLFPSVKPDEDFPGYVRFESGVMTLPFQFYNWSMSAVTNILHTAAQGQIKNRYGGFAAMLGIGYLMAYMRTPEYVWDELSNDQKLLAAIERSGISAVYGDVAINTVRALTQAGLNSPDNDGVNLPYYGKDGYIEAATTILGSGVSTIKDFSDGIYDIYNGQYGSALKEFYLMIPYSELFWLKEDSRAMINKVAKSIDE